MLKKSKGVTPILATVMLLFIAVAAVSSAAVFLQGTIDGIQEGAEDELEREELIENSDLRIQSGFNSSQGYMHIVVRNSGSVTMPVVEDSEKVWSIFVENSPRDSWSAPEDSIDPNQIININTTEPYPSNQDSKEVSISAPYETTDSYICYNGGSIRC
ncbi:MAG: hypothetical protein R6V35_05430 [Candidatus Nanohaloarchaea archaeon]